MICVLATDPPLSLSEEPYNLGICQKTKKNLVSLMKLENIFQKCFTAYFKAK